MIDTTEGTAAVVAGAVREARDMARFAFACDVQLAAAHDANVRRAVAIGVDITASTLAHALKLAPGSDARRAFMVACGAAIDA